MWERRNGGENQQRVRSCLKDGVTSRGNEAPNMYLGFLLEDGENEGKGRGEPHRWQMGGNVLDVLSSRKQ